MSYAEYKEQHNQKFQGLNTKKPQVKVEKTELDPTLKEYEKTDDTIGLSKKPKKTKEKQTNTPKVDEDEDKLNKNIGKTLKLNLNKT